MQPYNYTVVRPEFIKSENLGHLIQNIVRVVVIMIVSVRSCLRGAMNHIVLGGFTSQKIIELLPQYIRFRPVEVYLRHVKVLLWSHLYLSRSSWSPCACNTIHHAARAYLKRTSRTTTWLYGPVF